MDPAMERATSSWRDRCNPPSMSRDHALCLATVLLGAACARQVGTTAVTSADVEARSATAPTAADAAALCLADETCAREAACNTIGEGARYRTEEACLSDQSARAPAQ